MRLCPQTVYNLCTDVDGQEWPPHILSTDHPNVHLHTDSSWVAYPASKNGSAKEPLRNIAADQLNDTSNNVYSGIDLKVAPGSTLKCVLQWLLDTTTLIELRLAKGKSTSRVEDSTIVVLWQGNEWTNNCRSGDCREVTSENLDTAEEIARILVRYRASFVSLPEPAWRWRLPEQFNENNS